MCNFHYQGFVESVNELIRVRSDAKQLKVRKFFRNSIAITLLISVKVRKFLHNSIAKHLLLVNTLLIGAFNRKHDKSKIPIVIGMA